MSSEENNESLDYKVAMLIISILLILGVLAACRGPFLVKVFFIIMASIFPAMMYWLFIKNMKHGHLGVFFNNLDKLGLLGHLRIRINGECKKESELARERRIYTYLHKFQGVYGPFSDELRDDIDKKIQKTPDHPIQFNSTPTKFFKPQTCIPIFFATILITIGWVVALPPAQDANNFNLSEDICSDNLNATFPTELYTNVTEGLSSNSSTFVLNLGPLTPDHTPVNFAFLGAYLFSVVMLVHRYHRRDLRASAYVGVSLRIILAVILTWAVQALIIGLEITDSNNFFEPSYLMVVGFIIGVFPQTGWQLIEMFAKNVCGLVTPTFKTPLPLKEIEGLTIWNEARLEEEDIMNIPNMATADIVDLMLTTQISPDRIIDWVDQAILYTCIGPEGKTTLRKELRSHGIRNASSLIDIYRKNEDSPEILEKKLPKIDLNKIDTIIASMQNNPNLKLVRTWKKYPIRSRSKEPCEYYEL